MKSSCWRMKCHSFVKHSWLWTAQLACWIPQRKWSSDTLNSTCLKGYQSTKIFFLHFLSFVAGGTIIYSVSKATNMGFIPDSLLSPSSLIFYPSCQLQPLNVCPTHYSSGFSIVFLYANFYFTPFFHTYLSKMTVISFFKSFNSYSLPVG